MIFLFPFNSTAYQVHTPLDKKINESCVYLDAKAWIKYTDASNGLNKSTISWVRKGEEGGQDTAYHQGFGHYPHCGTSQFYGGGGTGECYYAICPIGSIGKLWPHEKLNPNQGKNWPAFCPCVKEKTESNYPIWEY